MIYAVPFGIALLIGGIASHRWGGATERHTMLLLSIVWMGTLFTNFFLGIPSAYAPLIYAVMDILALRWLFRYQSENWQWIVAALFTVMLLSHAVYVSGITLGAVSYQGRFYQHILAIAGYLQIVSVGFAIWERQSDARTVFTRWYFGDDWVSGGSVLRRAKNESSKRGVR